MKIKGAAVWLLSALAGLWALLSANVWMKPSDMAIASQEAMVETPVVMMASTAQKQDVPKKQKDWDGINERYGINEASHQAFLQQKEKSPAYYRALVNQKKYMWGANGNSDVDTPYFKEGPWIYPYLIEVIDDKERAQAAMTYPPDQDPFDSGYGMQMSVGNFARFYAGQVWTLYIEQDAYPKSTFEPLTEAQVVLEQQKSLAAYCEKFPQSRYCIGRH